MDSLQLTTRVKQALPPRAVGLLRRVKTGTDSLRYRGVAVECPVCGGLFKRFMTYNGRPSAMCPRCRLLERHRHFWIYLERETDLFIRPQRLLHIAAESELERRFRVVPTLEYLTGDLLRKEADIQLDVTNLTLPDAQFDVVLCSHVLEHVNDARAAMSELLRILRPGGWALLDAPVDPGLSDTYEDWTITAPAERQLAFGQWDHVRVFGRNFNSLLQEQGWQVEEHRVPLTPAEAERWGLARHNEVLRIGRKPA